MERRDELAAILADCCERLDRGEFVDRQALLAAHPELANELGSCFDLSDVLDQAVAEDTSGLLAEMPEAIDEYRLVREVGRGGMGVVYEAIQVSLDRKVALKVLAASFEGRAVRRFLQEVRAAGSLSHPNVVPIHAMGRYRGLWYYAMELVEGRPLDEVIGDDPEAEWPSLAETAKAFAGAADGLEAAHRAGIVHRDVKPSNLLLDETGRLRIVDFGLAQLGEGGVVTVSGALLGTPAYMSPEQAMAKASTLDHRTDVYSLGATLYEVLTRKPPHRGDSLQEICTKIVTREVETPRKVDPSIPRDLETIVLKAMEKDRSRRYPTARELAQDLRRFAEGDTIRARPTGVAGRLVTRMRRNRVRVALVAAVVVLAGLAVVLALRPPGGEAGASSTTSETAVSPAREASERELRRGTALRRRDNRTGAIAAFRRAIEIDPDNAAAYLALADVYRKLQRFEDCVAVAEDLLEREESAKAHWFRAHALRRLGRPEEAVRSARQSMKIDPAGRDDGQLVVLLLATERFEEALSATRRAIERRVKVPLMRRFEVQSLRALGQEDVARKRAEEHLGQGDTERSPATHAYLQAVVGQADAARETLRNYKVRRDAVNRAVVYAVLGDRDDVRHWLEIAAGGPNAASRGFAVAPDLKPYLDDAEIRPLLDRIYDRGTASR